MAVNVPLTSATQFDPNALAPVSGAGVGSPSLGSGIPASAGIPVPGTDYTADFTPGKNMQLARNPMLPQHPVTAQMDAEYAANEAILRAQVAKQYADVLQQLGYTDDSGNFIPGSVTTNAARQEGDLKRSSDIATEDVTHDMQRNGTLFSGVRGTQTARAQYPFQQQIAQLGIDVPLQLSQLYEQAAGLTDQYTLQNNQLLAAAAQRAAAALAQSGGIGSAAAAPATQPVGSFVGDNPISNPGLQQPALTPNYGIPAQVGGSFTMPSPLTPNYGIPKAVGGTFTQPLPNAYNRKTVANLH